MKILNSVCVWILVAVVFSGVAGAVCNDCLLKLIPQKTAGCPGDALIYKLKITNVNNDQKTFYMSVDSSIKDWMTYPATVALGPYEERLVDLVINLPLNAKPGTYELEVTASAGGVSDHAKTIATVENCYSATSLLNPSSMVVCRGDLADFAFQITNNGVREDTFSLRAVAQGLSSSLSIQAIPLLPGGGSMAVLRVDTATANVGEYSIKVLASSQRIGTEASGTLVIQDCQEGVVSAPPIIDFCLEDANRVFDMTVANGGRDPATYDISVVGTCKAVLSQYKVGLNPGESKKIQVNLKNNDNCVMTFGVSNGISSASTTTEVRVGACYGVDIEIVPPNNQICLCQPLNYDVVVRNTGTRVQTYQVSVDSPISMVLDKNVVTLEAGERAILKAKNVESTCCLFREFDFSASADSGLSKDTDNGHVSINPSETCHAIEIQADESQKSVLDCSGVDFVLEVKNVGYMEEEVRVVVDGPDWITAQPESFALDQGMGIGQIRDNVGEVRKVGLHLQPPAGTKPGVYPFKVGVSSPSAHDEIQLMVDVKSSSCNGVTPTIPVNRLPGGGTGKGKILPITTGYITRGIADSIFIVLLIGIILASVFVFYLAFQKTRGERGEGKRPVKLDETNGQQYEEKVWVDSNNFVYQNSGPVEKKSKSAKKANNERLSRINGLVKGSK